MSIVLTQEQQLTLDTESTGLPLVIDPRSNKLYLLVAADKYEGFQIPAPTDLDLRGAYPMTDAVAAKEGWDDPALDIYNSFFGAPQL